MEKIAYLGLPNCVRLSNDEVELVATTDVGPRLIRYGFRGEENVFGEVPEASIRTELGEWKPLGGHRLWTAPEAKPRSYAPDSEPVEFETDASGALHLRQSVEASTGIRKEMAVGLDERGTGVTVRHRLTNRGLWAVEVAPWALSIMRGGGEAIIPQEPRLTWEETVLPARPLVLWHYTDLNDPRWSVGRKLLRLRSDADLAEPQKAGVLNKQGWAAYLVGGTLFVKTVAYREGVLYPDYGSNTEAYTAGAFMEVETLGPIERLEPGQSATHVERWSLSRVSVGAGADEDELSASISAAVSQLTGEQF